jgi:hypothetical protein
MDAIDIINFARKPVPIREVWFLRVTTVSKNLMPITKTAYRRIGTPKEKLIDDLIVMIRGRLNAFMSVIDEETGFLIGATHTKGVDLLKGPFAEWLGEDGVDAYISCIITNVNDKDTFEIIPSWLPKDEQPPKSFSVRPSEKGSSVTLFVKCVRVKVK